MIPTTGRRVAAEIPRNATFWLPSEEELEELAADEGIGPFHDCRYFGDVSWTDACSLVDDESRHLGLIDQVASDALMFETLAGAIECGDIASLPANLPESAASVEIRKIAADDIGAAETYQGLDLGVAGLSFALSAIGCVTAASCRSHHADGLRAWSDRPVVIFAANHDLMTELVPKVEASGCGFAVCQADRRLLAIEAPSVAHTVRLAQSILRTP